MARILKNYTDEPCTVTCGATSVQILANDQYDLSETFNQTDLAGSDSLLVLISSGTDKYQMNDGISDLTMTQALELVRGWRPSVQAVKIQDVEDLDPARARSKVVGINFDVPAGQWAKKETSFPYRTNVLCGKGYGGFCEDGDKAEFSVAPQVIGVAAAAAVQGATEIYLYTPDPSVWGVLLDGMWLQFMRNPGQNPPVPDSSNPGDDEYEIADFDPVTGKITVRVGLAEAISQGDYIFLVVKYGELIEPQKNELIDVGSDSSGAAPLPENTVFNCWYYNAGQSTKRVRFRLSLKYGPLATS